MPTKPCPFCHLPPERIAGGNAIGLIVRDAYPVSPGHTLIAYSGERDRRFRSIVTGRAA
jgi:diadenosine tetraphosphate (Ap4A) HIT family hydrolase